MFRTGICFLGSLLFGPLALGSPLESIFSIDFADRNDEPALFQLEQRHHLYFARDSDRITEAARTITLQHDDKTRPGVPLISARLEDSEISGQTNNQSFQGSFGSRSLGFGLSVPGRHAVLLGPDRFELSLAGEGTERFTIGWQSEHQRRRLRLDVDGESWQDGFSRTQGEAYMRARQRGEMLAVHYRNEDHWGLVFNNARLAVNVSQSQESWPVLTDQWRGEKTNLQRFDLTRASYRVQYRPNSLAPLSAFGAAFQQWDLAAQAIAPVNGTLSAAQARAELQTRDLWAELHWSAWRTRLLLRNAVPQLKGTRYPLVLPGLGERFANSDIDRAWLLGTRIEFQPNWHNTVQTAFWAQAWLPLAVERHSDGEGSGSGDGGGSGDGDGNDGGGSGGGETPPHRQSRVDGGLQVGIRIGLRR